MVADFAQVQDICLYHNFVFTSCTCAATWRTMRRALRKTDKIKLIVVLKKIYTIWLFVSVIALAYASADSLSVAERNALQGFNDTIDRLAPDFVTVSLCIADPTDQSQDYLGITGHAFLRLQCPVFGLDYCFSYESEKIKGQLRDYLTGKLKMGMYAVPTDQYLEDYRVWQRAVHEYRLNLPPEAEQRLWEQMDNHMLSERDMQMNLIRFGCTNTVLRYVERALSPAQICYNWPDKYLTKSAMELMEEHLEAYPWTLWGIRLTAGKEFSEFTTPKQKVIIPTDLLEVWTSATIDGEPVLTYIADLVEAEPVVAHKPWFTPRLCGVLLLLIMAGGIGWAIIRVRKKKQSQLPHDRYGTDYPLLPYSRLVFDATRCQPDVYRFLAVLRWHGGAAQKEKAENALRTTLANHPVFASRVDSRGRQYMAEPEDILHGQYHDIDVSVLGVDLLITARMSRILGDGKSAQILAEDILRAYHDAPLAPDDYWGYVAALERRKTQPHYSISQTWLTNEYADTSVPVRPTMDRKCLFTLRPPKSGLYQADYTDLHAKIQSLSEKSYLSFEGIFSLCTAMAIAEYCGTDEAALTWAYEGRETPEEQRIFGSLHRDIPFHIRNSKIENRQSLIRETRNQIRSGIAHSDYPYTLTAPYTKRWNYAVNVLRVPDEEDMKALLPEQIELLPAPPQKYAYALLDVEIHEHPGTLALWFRYSATHYKQSSIRRFAALIRQYAEWLINPE